jgi:hypothetical protein
MGKQGRGILKGGGDMPRISRTVLLTFTELTKSEANDLLDWVEETGRFVISQMRQRKDGLWRITFYKYQKVEKVDTDNIVDLFTFSY